MQPATAYHSTHCSTPTAAPADATQIGVTTKLMTTTPADPMAATTRMTTGTADKQEAQGHASVGPMTAPLTLTWPMPLWRHHPQQQQMPQPLVT